MTQSRIYTVSGTVQGVWFRAFTAEEATRIGIRGWVRNTADGNVELLAYGTENQLQQLEQELWKGSPMSKVASVEYQPSDLAPPDNFEIQW